MHCNAYWRRAHSRPRGVPELAGSLTAAAADGDVQAALKRRLVLSELAVLRALPGPPALEDETADLKWVRQSKRYRVWRVSHPYHPGVAVVRLICWFLRCPELRGHDPSR